MLGLRLDRRTSSRLHVADDSRRLHLGAVADVEDADVGADYGSSVCVVAPLSGILATWCFPLSSGLILFRAWVSRYS